MVSVLAKFDKLAPNFVLDEPGVVDMNMIVNLASLGVINGALRETGLLARLIHLLQHRCESARSLLVRTCVLAAVCSSLLTNDATVLVLTTPVLESARRFSAPLEPFALALVTSANLGSALTVIGNPQNVLIASISGMSFGRYTLLCAPAVTIGWLLNLAALVFTYGASLRRCRVGPCLASGYAPADDSLRAAAHTLRTRMAVLSCACALEPSS